MFIASENNERDEIVLWNSFIKGDKDAFSAFYKVFYPKLFAYGLRLRVSEEYVRDIIQELFLKLYTKPEIIKEPETLRAYLFMSFRNACINHEMYSRKHVDISNINTFDLQFSIENTSIEEEEEKEYTRQKVKEILDDLTPRQREIIYLRFLHQMEYEEISRIMNLSGQAARNLIHRAIDSIRKNNKYSPVVLLP
ncbi:MAG: sigma-70 family RNA polymerase sigma factor [Prevotella sp.]|jgi:RNA polymerase sigma factor (sigma-70 family)|nr:sigma-70 family RNA polymerase sigma factor [Prevotella sp.]